MPRIRVIDFETTGFEPPAAQVVEVGLCDVVSEGAGWRIDRRASYLCGADPIPPEVRAVHHITPADVWGLPPFDPAALWVEAVDVMAAHNAEFEAKFWGTPTRPVLCTYKAALRVWPTAPSHSNGALRYWLQDQGAITPDAAACQPSHRAGPDAYVTAHILTALLSEATAQQMVAWTKEPRLLPTCPIGKFRGKPWAEVEGGFLQWMLKQADMEADLKWNAERELRRRSQPPADDVL